tara:strand:+ start:396 stop:698 length:303 start_codon:yes stop_codon:yes gene_type:complete
MTFKAAPRSKTNLNKFKKAELIEALIMYQVELDKTKEELCAASQRSELLTIDDYGQDFVNRCELHGKEFKLFMDDLSFVSKFLTAKIKEVRQVELPAFLK